MNYCRTSPIGDKAGRGKSRAHRGRTLDNHFKKKYRCNRPHKTHTPRGVAIFICVCQFVVSLEETFVELKLRSFCRHDFNVHAAPASGIQLVVDGLSRA